MPLGSGLAVSQTPRAIPAELAARIQEVEDSLSDEERVGLRWKLTWLENRAVVELDNGVILRG